MGFNQIMSPAFNPHNEEMTGNYVASFNTEMKIVHNGLLKKVYHDLDHVEQCGFFA